MDKRSVLIIVAVASAAFMLFVVAAFTVMFSVLDSASMGDYGGSSSGKVKIGVVEVKGMISAPDDTLRDLRRFEDREDIKAIVVRVDSPGGAVAPSQEIHDAIVRVGKTKPVVISMGNVAASGGFYLAVGASQIYAEPGTLTGSIGVIAEMPEVDQLMDWAHVKMTVVKSGKLKDIGSPFRPMTDDDRKFFQGLIDDVYGQFLKAVVEGRKLPVEKVRPIADGRVLSGSQAKELGLIDKLGGFEDAAEGAVALAHETGKPRLVYPPKDTDFKLQDLVKESSSSAIAGLREAATPPMGLLFLAPVGQRQGFIVNQLWAPWRLEFIEQDGKPAGCIFCDFPAQQGLEADRKNLILGRSRHSFAILNKFPYNNGHLMVVPRRHTADFAALQAEEADDLSRFLQLAVRALTQAYHPEGCNLGMNLGRVAGAGIADHLHWHAVPRWSGDTNFMPVIGETKVMIEHVLASYDRLRAAFEALLPAAT